MSIAANTTIDYPVVITNVREVALTGTAQIDFWRDHLKHEGLHPYSDQGRASFLITALESKFKGITFREASFSIVTSDREDGSTSDGAYLIHAYNSLRLFAYVERTFFSTPYYAGDIGVNERIPAHMQIRDGGDIVFRAQMAQSNPAPSRHHDLWEAPIYLPGRKAHFYARLSGEIEVYPFAASDVLTITPSPRYPVFGWLLDTGFTPGEWHIRPNGTHGKSKTFQKSR